MGEELEETRPVSPSSVDGWGVRSPERAVDGFLKLLSCPVPVY